MDDRDIARWRLHAQRLAGPSFANATDVVRGLLAVQAENYSQASWALATRSEPGIRAADVDSLLDRGDLLRAHVLRTTWHFVDPEDIVWLCELTGPRLARLYATQRRTLGIDELAPDAAVATVVAAIDADGPQTRQQLSERLLDAGLRSDGQALTLVTAMAEAIPLICSGPRRGAEHTYDLITRRAPNARRLDRSAALAELAVRYIAGHGPATERDLAYWATLTVTDARAGLRAVADQLGMFDHDGRRYWHVRDSEPLSLAGANAHLLQILDEMYRGYQDSRWVLDADRLLNRGRETSIGMALLDGQIAGTMTRTANANLVEFSIGPHRPITLDEHDLLAEVADRYGTFLGLTAQLRIA
jgi:hypothetical protein